MNIVQGIFLDVRFRSDPFPLVRKTRLHRQKVGERVVAIMSVALHQLEFYALAMFGLWIVPGPVWVALIARALSGGIAGAWPLAAGAALGNVIWPFGTIFGLGWVLSAYGNLLDVMQWGAAAFFFVMGSLLVLQPAISPKSEGRLTRTGFWSGFAVGIAAVIVNPKSLLFYMGLLPGFFDLTSVTTLDVAAILTTSAVLSGVGNLGLVRCLDRKRRLLQSPENLRRLKVVSGVLLALVGLKIPFT